MAERRTRRLNVKVQEINLAGDAEVLQLFGFPYNTRIWTDGFFGLREAFTTTEEMLAVKVLKGNGRQETKKGRGMWRTYRGGGAMSVNRKGVRSDFSLRPGDVFYTYEKGHKIKEDFTPLDHTF